MKHVELIGVAGAGKSTVATQLRSRNQDVRSLTDLHGTLVSELLFPGRSSTLGARLPSTALSHLARVSGLSDRGVNFFSLKYPDMLPLTSRYVHKYTDDADRIDYVTGSTLDLVEQFGAVEEYADLLECERTTDEPVLLIDEGFAFAAAAVFHPPQHSRRFAIEDLREFASSVPVPDAIVFVRASPETCTARMSRRDAGVPASWEHLDPGSYVDFAAEATLVAETIAEAFESRGAHIVEVETEDRPVRQSVSEVERVLSRATSS